MSIYEFKPLKSSGEVFDMADLEGKVFIVVNVASKCGLVPQYEELEQMYRDYADQGFSILAFPCNQFGWQEPESDDKIAEFCQLRYGVTFPVLRKVLVNGSGQEPLFGHLKDQISGKFGFKGIKWNFEKFLVNRSGVVVGRYQSTTTPGEMRPDVEQLLQNN